jgi:hypothetical protein
VIHDYDYRHERLKAETIASGDSFGTQGSSLYCRADFGCILHESTEAAPPVQGSIVDAIEALRNAGGDAWDDVEDPRAFLDDSTEALIDADL